MGGRKWEEGGWEEGGDQMSCCAIHYYNWKVAIMRETFNQSVA